LLFFFGAVIIIDERYGILFYIGKLLFRKRLKAAFGKISNRENVLGRIGDAMVISVKGNFARGSSPGGRTWDALKKPVGGRTRALVPGNRIDASISRFIAGDAVHIGYDSDIGLFHNEGTSRMAMRRFLGFRDVDNTMIADEIRDHVQQAFA
jgi:phage gpG-like protein